MSRGMVKWQPFNAVVSGNAMVSHILSQKNQVRKPVLSEDQLYLIQEKILEAWQNQEIISVKFYRDGRIYMQSGKITSIDSTNRKLILNQQNILFFSQIIEIL